MTVIREPGVSTDNCHANPEDHVFAGQASDRQEGGLHYKTLSVEPWDAMEAWMTKEQFQGFLIGSAIAYLARFNVIAPGKGGVLDIRKARHYLDKLIEVSSD